MGYLILTRMDLILIRISLSREFLVPELTSASNLAVKQYQ